MSDVPQLDTVAGARGCSSQMTRVFDQGPPVDRVTLRLWSMFLAMAACMEVKGSVRPLSSETVVAAPSGTVPGCAVGAGGAACAGCADPAGLAACCTCAAAAGAAACPPAPGHGFGKSRKASAALFPERSLLL